MTRANKTALLLLAFLSICFFAFGSQRVPPTPTPVKIETDTETKAPEPMPDPPGADEARRYMERLVASLERVADRAEASDPLNAMNIRQSIQAMRDLFVPSIVITTKTGDVIENVVTHVGTCLRADPCLTIIPARRADMPYAYALWWPSVYTVFLDPDADPDDGVLTFVLLHELEHVRRSINGDDRFANDSSNLVPDLLVPEETNAHRAQSAYMNAATHGKYFDLVERTATEVFKGKRPFIEPRSCLIPEIPRAELEAMFPSENGKPMPLGARSVLETQFVLDLNVYRVLMSGPNVSPEDPAIGRVYANCILEMRSKEAEVYILHAPEVSTSTQP